MSLFASFIVALSLLQVVLGTAPGNDNTTPKNGYSFDLQSDAVIPPPVNYDFTTPVDGNPYTVIAGTGDAGITDGVNSPTITAPQFMWKTTTGSIFFTDTKNSLLRVLNKDGTLNTLVGHFGAGFSGDGGAYVMAKLNKPRGISGSASGVWIADTGNARIRFVNLRRTIQTVAGSANRGYSGDGGLATNAELHSPYGVWVDASNDDFYFTELHMCTIRKVEKSSGIITTVAGVAGTCDSNGDSNPALNTFLNKPRAIFGSGGAVYFTEFGSNLARKLDPVGGSIVTIAGGKDAQKLTNEGDGNLATQAALNGPSGIWVDKDSNAYISESYASVVRKVSASDGTISTVMGVHGARGPFTKVTSVKNVLYHPRGVYGDDTFHQLYLSDTDNHRIVAYTLPHAPGLQINTVAGNGGNYEGPYTDADALTSGLGNTGNMWQDSNGIIYFSSTSSILTFDPVNKKISTFAGTGQGGTPVDGSPALSTSFYTLSGLWGDSTGLYAADFNNRLVLKFSWTDGNPVSIIAGGGNGAVSSTPITATTASLQGPYGLWGDGNGLILITDQTACAIYALNNGQITLAVGGNCNTFPNQPRNLNGLLQGNSIFLAFGYSDGLGIALLDPTRSQFVPLSNFGSGIEQINFSPDRSSLFYARSRVNQIFVSPNANSPGRVVAGDGDALYYGDGGDANIASLNNPIGVWLDPNTKSLYISDQDNNRIRAVTDPVLPNRRLSEEELLSTTTTTFTPDDDTPLIASMRALFLSPSISSHSSTTFFNNNTTSSTRFSTTASSITKQHLRRM